MINQMLEYYRRKRNTYTIVVDGIIADELTINGRIYSKEILELIRDQYQIQINNKRACVEISTIRDVDDDTSNTRANIERIFGVIEEVQLTDRLTFKVRILKTQIGRLFYKDHILLRILRALNGIKSETMNLAEEIATESMKLTPQVSATLDGANVKDDVKLHRTILTYLNPTKPIDEADAQAMSDLLGDTDEK